MTEARRGGVRRAPSPLCCRSSAPRFGLPRAPGTSRAVRPPLRAVPALTASGRRVFSARLSGTPQPRRSGRSRSACGALPAALRSSVRGRAAELRGAAPAPGRRRGPAGRARPRPLGPPRSWAPSDPCWGPEEDGEGRAGPRDPCAGPGAVGRDEGRVCDGRDG